MPWSKILGFVGQLGSGIISAIGGALTLVNNMMAFGFRTAMQYHEEGIAFARTMGMSAKEAVAYTQVLTDRATTLGQKYGIAANAIKEIQKNIVDATGKQYMLNQEEVERMIQINKLVGAETNKAFTEEIVNHLGGQLSAAQSAVSKAYATAAKSGLSAAKFSEKVAKNLTLANKLTFRDGVNGIIKMTSLSEKLGFNLQSVSGVADKFMELDQAISTSAQLQMLGGPAAAFGANPLTMAYEANYDMEALTERMTNMLSGYATFNRATGVADVNGMNRQFVYEISKAMGISMDEAMSIAKKQAEIKYKEGAYGRELGNISKENRDAVLNRSYIDTETGHLMINDIKGEKHDITENGLDETIIEELKKFDNMSEKEIMEKQSQTLISINEKIEGIWTSLGGQLADVFNKHMPKIQKFVDGIGTSLNNAMPKITEALSKLMDDILKPENLDKIQEYIPKLADNVATFLASGIDFFKKAVEFFEKIDNGINSLAMALGAFLGIKWMNKGNTLQANPQAHPKSTNTPPPTNPSGNGGANPRGSNLNKPSNTIKHQGKEYKQDSRGQWKVKQKDGSWKNVDKGMRKTLNEIKGQQTQVPNTTTTQPSVPSTPTSSGKGGFFNKVGRFFKGGGGKLLKGAKAGARGSAPLTAVIAGFEGYMAHNSYESAKEDILSNGGNAKEKAEALNQAKIQKDKSYGSAVGGAAGAIAGAAAGAAIGSVVPVIGTAIGGLIGGFLGSSLLSEVGEKVAENVSSSISEEDIKGMIEEKHAVGGIIGVSSKQSIEKHDVGGIIGGNSYSGDNILGLISNGGIGAFNSGEMVVPMKEQGYLYDFIKKSLPQVLNNMSTINYTNTANSNISNITSVLPKTAEVKSKPVVGEKPEYIYKPNGTETSNINGNTITVKDFNINLSGTLKLDGGNSSKNIDMNALLNDYQFMNALKEMIKTSINNDMNGGRFMNDLAARRGQVSSSSIIGR
jgi:hypothetical protein